MTQQKQTQDATQSPVKVPPVPSLGHWAWGSEKAQENSLTPVHTNCFTLCHTGNKKQRNKNVITANFSHLTQSLKFCVLFPLLNPTQFPPLCFPCVLRATNKILKILQNPQDWPDCFPALHHLASVTFWDGRLEFYSWSIRKHQAQSNCLEAELQNKWHFCTSLVSTSRIPPRPKGLKLSCRHETSHRVSTSAKKRTEISPFQHPLSITQDLCHPQISSTTLQIPENTTPTQERSDCKPGVLHLRHISNSQVDSYNPFPISSQPCLKPAFVPKPAITIITAQTRASQRSSEQRAPCLRALKVVISLPPWEQSSLNHPETAVTIRVAVKSRFSYLFYKESRDKHYWLGLLAHHLQNCSGMWENSVHSPAQTSAAKRVAALHCRCLPWKTHRSCPCWSAKPWYLLKSTMQLAAQPGITQGQIPKPSSLHRQLPKLLHSSQSGFAQSKAVAGVNCRLDSIWVQSTQISGRGSAPPEAFLDWTLPHFY